MENQKKVPVLYEKKENCCGCSACCQVCPRSAITMKSDDEGFEYPVIDVEKCIGCYKCITVCPFKEKEENQKKAKNNI